MAKLKLEDILKGRESLAQEDYSSSASKKFEEQAAAISQLSQMIAPEVLKIKKKHEASTSASEDLGSPSVARDIKEIKNSQGKLLEETKKTNSLLSNFINSQSKVFENNNELIERLLLASEQERERKKQTGEAIAKTGERQDKNGKSAGAVDIAGGSAGLAALLFGLAPEIAKALEKIPMEIRDASVAAGILVKRALYSLADTISVTASDVGKSVLESLGIKKTPEPIKLAPSESNKASSKITGKPTAEPVKAPVEDEEIRRRKSQERARSAARDEKGRFLKSDTIKPEAAKVPSGEPMPKPSGAGTDAVIAVGEEAATYEAKLAKKLTAFLGKNAVKAVAKTIPFVGAGVAAFSAYEDAGRGDFRGAIANSIATIGSLMSATGIGAVVGEPAAIAAMTEDLIDKAYAAVYSEEGKPADYWEDMKNNPKLFGERMAWLAPKVAEAVYKEVENYSKEKGYGLEADHSNEEAVYNPETGTVLYYQPKVQPAPDQGGTGRRETKSPSLKPVGVNPATSGQGYTPPVYPVGRKAPRIDRDHMGGGSTTVNDNRTINNIDNSKAGGGGSAPGFPNSSTAPSNPWDAPLYGANMNYF